MVKYLRKVTDRLKLFLSGMQGNAPLWVGQPETDITVKAKIALLEAKETEIINKKEELSVLYAEARALKSEADKFAEGIENLARGLHKSEPEKLSEYGIPPVKPRTPTNPPTMALTVVLKDDTDGEGFIVSVQSADPDAENYVWEKGVSANAADTQTIPPMSYRKQSSKMTFVDDDIIKGSRYWYRVRSVNNKGEGPWSDATSRVQ